MIYSKPLTSFYCEGVDSFDILLHFSTSCKVVFGLSPNDAGLQLSKKCGIIWTFYDFIEHFF